jgi:hypothetical protein
MQGNVHMPVYLWREILGDWGNYAVLTFNNSAVYLILLGWQSQVGYDEENVWYKWTR